MRAGNHCPAALGEFILKENHMRLQAALTALLAFSTVLVNADEPFRLHQSVVTVPELQDALGLDIYSFHTKAKKGDKFKIVLREFAKQDAEPVVLFKESFVVGKLRDNESLHLIFSFLKPDNTIGSALGSNLPTMNLKLSAADCKPSLVTKNIAVPMAGVADKDVRGLSGNVFLKITNPRGDTAVYPYAELVIERDE
jgi:hypothetical protein